MNNYCILCFLILFAACGNKTDISVAQFQLILKDTNVQLLDVRTPQEFAEGHLPNAKLLDWQNQGDFIGKIQKIDAIKPTCVYCKSGTRSGQAASYLLSKGFKNVYTLQGGIEAWQAAKLNVVLNP